MKGIGNYSGPRRPEAAGAPAQLQQERRVGTLALFQGDRAIVRFPGALAYAMPARLFKAMSILPGSHFAMVITRDGAKVVDIRVEPHSEARPVAQGSSQPKVYVRDGDKFSTSR